ncbi:MAG TPA: hypothetical protein PKM21_11970 [Anaerolineales bacterium]|nr:hypothetical protein [Anaerolineales bacterium]
MQRFSLVIVCVLILAAAGTRLMAVEAAGEGRIFLPLVVGPANGNLCAGLVTDLADHPMTPLAKPALGQAVLDPQFGTVIRRISEVGGQGVIKPLYSPMQAWSAGETYLLLYQVDGGHLLYDGQTYQYLRQIDIDPPDIEQVYWSTSDPDSLYWIGGNVLYRYRVSSDSSQPLHTIDSCPGAVRADSHAWISWDARYLGLYCAETDTAFLYDIEAGAVLGSLAPADGNAPFISASGRLAYWLGNVLDPSMNILRSLDLGNPGEHSSLGRLANGHDTFNLVQYDPGPGGSEEGTLLTFDMTDGTYRVIVGPQTGYPYPPSGTHISAPVYERPGWVFVSIIGDPSGARLLDQELLLANTNPGGTVCRIGHHRSQEAQEYWGEPHVSGSPSGTRALFASDWGGGPSVDTYVIELPSYIPTP